jgi:DNA-binding CsgD family transcriptional regulator
MVSFILNGLQKLYFPISIKQESETAIKISEREKEFLKYTVTELSYKEIADRMCCSPRTVESYRDQLCEKLDLKTRVGLLFLPLKMVLLIKSNIKLFY